MPNVIVVPETEDFEHDVSHRNVVWINRNLGIPRLKAHDARYVDPNIAAEVGVEVYDQDEYPAEGVDRCHV